MNFAPKTLILFSAVLTGAACASSVPDTSSDLDCTIVTALFSKGARLENAPLVPKEALALFNNWYAFESTRTGEAKGPKATDQHVETIRLELTKDMAKANKALDACADRARRNPRFEPFAKAAGWRGKI